MVTKGVYLTMVIGEELFAVSVDKTREILDSISTTRLPNMPDYMSGVINVRGSAIPVVDMRLKLELPVREEPGAIPVIVLEVPGTEEVLLIGAMVDEVREVVEVPAEDMEAAPSVGRGLMADFLFGMYQHGERLVMVLDTERLFTQEEQSLFSGIGDTEAASSEVEPETVVIPEKTVEPEIEDAGSGSEEEPVQPEPESQVESTGLLPIGVPTEELSGPGPQPKKRKKPVRRKKKVDVQVEIKIAQQMEKVGITVTELAAKIDMDKRTLKRLITEGNPNTTIATLKRIAEGIGCSWKELVD